MRYSMNTQSVELHLVSRFRLLSLNSAKTLLKDQMLLSVAEILIRDETFSLHYIQTSHRAADAECVCGMRLARVSLRPKCF